VKGAVLLLLVSGVAFPLVVGFHVEPVCVSQSGWTQRLYPNNYVSQVLTINFDELDSTAGAYVELFAGAEGNGGAYTATVFDGNTQLMYSAGDKVPDHGWVKFKNWNTQVAFTKGKTVTIPPDSDSEA
jgi:hypothetical protein